MLAPTALSFRPLTLDDLPLLHRWYHSDAVLRWYSQRWHTLQEVVGKLYGLYPRTQTHSRLYE